MKLGVVGLGYWGPNIVRNAVENSRISSVTVCDMNPDNVKRVTDKYAVRVADSYNAMLSSDVDIIAVITPISTHYTLAKKALEASKHILVEKPFTVKPEEAEELIQIAKEKNLKILVDHTFVYTSAVRKLREMVDSGEVGKIYYFDSVRVNLGLFQHDVNVVWDLAPHDFSIMNFLVSEKPVALSAQGAAHIGAPGIQNMSYIHVEFGSGLVAHFHVNWLSPVKIRKTLIGGSKKMIEYDDLNVVDKIKVYDKGVVVQDVKDDEEFYKELIQYRSGDVHVPQIDNTEALQVMIDHFLDCIEQDRCPDTDGDSGLKVVKLLDAAERSMAAGGAKVQI
ncbi:MAG: Gfo/Idh/MocA family oxidoreductase [Calditrichaeota bacterium]|jgi:predicted dehydrogenase|nr:Gfo/Idh/MocA family oxidoreductase [Calditrichota bacterium]